MGIADFKWVERPFDEADIAAQGFVALKQFQHPSDAAVAIVYVHAGHMRMQICAAIAQGCQRQREAYQCLPGKCSEYLAAGVRSHHKSRRWLDLQILFSPDRALQRDAVMKLFQRLALPNRNGLVYNMVGSPAHT